MLLWISSTGLSGNAVAIAFDAFGEGYNNGTSLTYSHTCGGSDRFLFLVVKLYGNDDITAITYNGVSMGASIANGSLFEGTWSRFYALMNPASGANNLVITRTSSNHIVAGSGSWTGVSQTGQPEAFGTAEANGATQITPSVTVATANAWVVGGVIANYDGTSFVNGSNSVMRGDSDVSLPGICAVYDRNADLSAGAQTLDMKHSSGTNQYSSIALSIAPATGGGAVAHKRLALLGVG